MISKLYRELKKLDINKPNNPILKWGADLNRGFSTEKTQMAEEAFFKRCSTILAIREMQIKTSLRFHLAPVRMAKIKNTSDSSCCQRCEARGNAPSCW